MDIIKAKEILSSLAQGVDPQTGELLEENHICNRPETIRAFYCILRVIGDPVEKSVDLLHENARKPWTTKENNLLCELYDAGATRRELCNTLKRSSGDIAARLVRLGKIDCRKDFCPR